LKIALKKVRENLADWWILLGVEEQELMRGLAVYIG
jgi:hypothetical protein